MEGDKINFYSTLPATNYFCYKGKHYPFNLDLFKLFSKSFVGNQFTLLPNACFNLVNDSECNIPLSDESINYFINYCQNQGIPKTDLSNEDILSLNYLAKQYQIQSLIKLTEKLILQRQDYFIIYFLTNPDLDNLNRETFENILSQKLLDYIEDPQLLLLPVPSLSRILTKYRFNSDVKNQKEIMEFLFKCLDKKGRCASALFANVDLTEEKTVYLNRLLNKYSEIFDFNFINKSLAKSLYEVQSELVKTKETIEATQIDISQKVSNDFENIQSVKNEINQANESMKCEIKKEIDQKKKEIDQIANSIKSDFNLIKDEFNQFRKEVKSVKDELSIIKRENDQIKDEMNKKFVEMNNYFCSLISENNLKQQKQSNQLKRIVLEINSENQFDDVNYLKTFNKFNGQSQVIAFQKVANINNDQTMKNIYDLLLFFSDESQKDDFCEESNYIHIDSNEPLSRLKNIESISISSETTSMLYKNGSLNSESFIEKIKKIDNSYIEIQYPSENFQQMFECVAQVKELAKIKVSILISGITETDDLFRNNKVIDRVRIGSSVSKIKGGFNLGSFENCASLENVFILGSNLSSIGGRAFNLCKKLKQFIIPSSITIINGGVFSECSSLAEITIPSTINSIEQCAFQKCINLKRITIDPYKTRIDVSAFQSCSSLNCLIFASSVTEIKPFNFDQFWNLKEMIMNDSVRSIQNNSFDQCLQLEKITISQSIPSIEANLFNNSQKLSEVIINRNKTKFKQQSFEIKSTLNDKYILKPLIVNKTNNNQTSNNQTSNNQTNNNQTNNNQSNNKQSNNNQSSNNQSRNNQMHIPLRIISKNIITVNINSSITEIPDQCLSNCTSLIRVIFDPVSSLKSIGKFAFKGCNLLTEISFPSSLLSIDDLAFFGCCSLKKITITNSINWIGNSVFSNCTRLESIQFEKPSSLTTIGNFCFNNCNKLKNIALPPSVKSVGICPFESCTALRKVEIPRSIILYSYGKNCNFTIHKY